MKHLAIIIALLVWVLPVWAQPALHDHETWIGGRVQYTYTVKTSSGANVDMSAKDSVALELFSSPRRTTRVFGIECADTELTCSDGSLAIDIQGNATYRALNARTYYWRLAVYESGITTPDIWIVGEWVIRGTAEDPSLTGATAALTVSSASATLTGNSIAEAATVSATYYKNLPDNACAAGDSAVTVINGVVSQTDCGTFGSNTKLDLANDNSFESTGIKGIETTGDTNSIFTEPAADTLRVNMGQDWPKSDSADVALDSDSLASLSAGRYGRELSTIGQLTASAGAAGEYRVVVDSLRGGVFRWRSGGTLDSVTVYSDGASGYWHRLYDGVNVAVEWAGAKGDGSTTDTPSIQEALNALSKGQILHFRKGRTYKTGVLTLSTSGIEIDGHGATFSASASSDLFQTSNMGAGATLALREMRYLRGVSMSGDVLQTDAGTQFDRLVLDGVHALDGPLLRTVAPTSGTPNRYVTVRNSSSDSSATDAITFQAVEYVLIEHSSFSNPATDAIKFNVGPVRQVRIRNNRFSECSDDGLDAYGGGAEAVEITGNYFDNCTISVKSNGNTGNRPDTQGWTISANAFYNSGGIVTQSAYIPFDEHRETLSGGSSVYSFAHNLRSLEAGSSLVDTVEVYNNAGAFQASGYSVTTLDDTNIEITFDSPIPGGETWYAIVGYRNPDAANDWYEETVSSGSQTYAIAHSLATERLNVRARKATDLTEVSVTVTYTDRNNISVDFGSTTAADHYIQVYRKVEGLHGLRITGNRFFDFDQASISILGATQYNIDQNLFDNNTSANNVLILSPPLGHSTLLNNTFVDVETPTYIYQLPSRDGQDPYWIDWKGGHLSVVGNHVFKGQRFANISDLCDYDLITYDNIVHGSTDESNVVFSGPAACGNSVTAYSNRVYDFDAGTDYSLVSVDKNLAAFVIGPSSSTNTAIARFNGTGGKTIQNSGVTIDGSNNVAGAGTITTSSDVHVGNFSVTQPGVDSESSRNSGALGDFTIWGKDSGASNQFYARFGARIESATAGSEDSQAEMKIIDDGAITDYTRWTSNEGVYVKALAAAPADGDFAAAECLFWLDESNNEVELKCKESDGSSIITNTLTGNYGETAVMSYGSGAPTATDCDADAERHRMYVDTAGPTLYVCRGATGGWDSVALTD